MSADLVPNLARDGGTPIATDESVDARTNPDLRPDAPVGKPAWHALPVDQVVQALGTHPQRGLEEAEAARRLAEHGPNTLPEAAAQSPWKLFLAQFRSLVIWVLIAAGVVSGLLGEAVDATAILAIVLLNAIIGFYQEYSAEKSIAALRKMTAPTAKVRRDGKTRNLPAFQVVRGDLLEFESGDLIPADGRLVEVSDLRCVEAALTGESEAVEKFTEPMPGGDLPLGDRVNMVFMGTSVAAGSGRAVAVGTGLDTEIGRIARLLESASADEATPLQKRLDTLGRTLVWISLGLVALLFLLGLWRGMEPFELFLTSISLAVAAAPEGLPAVVTVALALGVQRMARRKALVRRLPSVETLGSATVICTDKTGTLTAGEMTVRELYVAGETFHVDGAGLEPEGEVSFSGRAPDGSQSERLRHLASIQVGTVTADLYFEEGRWKVAGDPTEGALLSAGRKVGLDEEEYSSRDRVFAFPFDSERKRTSVIRRLAGGGARIQVNGAPDVLLKLCDRVYTAEGPRPLDGAERGRIEEANAAMARQGLRVIGSAYRESPSVPDRKPSLEEVESDLVFVGLAGMYDPPRPEARAAVAKCHQAGIRVVMITGDHPATARAIAHDLGIIDGASGILTGKELDGLDGDALREKVESTAVYARVSAEHKLRVVRAWRELGAVVAMTGDGVNDAPALKGAHIGIAMGRTGTEVTKQASDMIIADDNFASIVAAVEEGRGIYQNIRNTLQFLLAGNTGELLLMMVAILAGLPSPLLAIHLLWINLVTDGLPALCLAAERIDPDIMKREPRRQAELMSDRGFRNTLLLTGILTAGVSLAAFLWAYRAHGLEAARSAAFSALVFAELLRSLGARSETRPLWRTQPRGNLPLLAVVAAFIGLQVFSLYNGFMAAFLKTTPISPGECLALLALSSLPLVVLEIFKASRWRPATGNPPDTGNPPVSGNPEPA